METWTIKWETINGTIKETEVKADTDTEAVRKLCRLYAVAQVLAVSDCYRVQWV